MSNIISQIQISLGLPYSCTSSLFKVAYIFIDYNLLPASKASPWTNKSAKNSGTSRPGKFRDLDWSGHATSKGYRDIGTVSGRDGTGPRFRRKMSGRTLSDVDKIVEHAKVRLNYRKQLIHETMCSVAVPGRRTPYPIQNCSSQERTCCLSPKLSPLT